MKNNKISLLLAVLTVMGNARGAEMSLFPNDPVYDTVDDFPSTAQALAQGGYLWAEDGFDSFVRRSDSLDEKNRDDDVPKEMLKSASKDYSCPVTNFYGCEICPERFRLEEDLKNHKMVHSGIKFFQCVICYKNFTKSSGLIRHSAVHTGEKKFPCRMCDRSFTDSSGRYKHEKIKHNDLDENKLALAAADSPVALVEGKMDEEQDWDLFSTEKGNETVSLSFGATTLKNNEICHLCNKSFTKKGNLEAHMRVHTRETPFQCGKCPKSFTQKGNLKAHMRVHTCETPFQCGKCPKFFNQKGNRDRHEKTQHDDSDDNALELTEANDFVALVEDEMNGEQDEE